VTISRTVPNIRSGRPAETRDFFVELLGFDVAMDMGWVVTVASPTNTSAQVTIVGNDDMAAPGISVEVADVDAVHAKAVERGFDIAYPLRDEEWGVRRTVSAKIPYTSKDAAGWQKRLGDAANDDDQPRPVRCLGLP
jgi:hypothetical protein